MTDADHGIGPNDTMDDWAEHAVRVEVKPRMVGWRWEVYQVDAAGYDGETDEWEIESGWEGTREQAEAAGEAAKESYIRDLIRK